MLIRKLCMVSLAFGFVLPASCGGGDDDSGTNEGGGVGAACSADSQCTGYSKPSCITEIKPLETLASPTAPAELRNFTIPFPGGYCSNKVEDSCAGDADCGEGGGCFLAFEGVPQTTIDNLNALNLGFDVNAFADVGICMKKCSSAADCREGYQCMVPLADLLATFNDTYMKTFCVQDVDTSFLLGAAQDAG